jgi:hypothetical protein
MSSGMRRRNYEAEYRSAGFEASVNSIPIAGFGISCASANDPRLVLLLTNCAPLSSNVARVPSARESELFAQAAPNKTIVGDRLCLNMFYSPRL